jgi:hypothetical protein
MAFFRLASVCLIVCALLVSCAKPEIHIHDRHSLSSPLVESYAGKHPDATLVLFDYHHDIGHVGEEALSANWVARFLREDRDARVIWVSGRDLAAPDRGARLAWLRRGLVSFAPGEAARLESRVELATWHELEKRSLGAPLVISLDFDIFCQDQGSSPERFLDEIGAWIRRRKPDLVTLALSAAYEDDPSSAFSRLERFVAGWGAEARGSAWFLEAGPRNPRQEGYEERNAWRLWEERPDVFGGCDAAFYPGAGIWIAPPQGLCSVLLALGAKPGDDTAKDVLSGWRDADIAELGRRFSQVAMDEILAASASALEDAWKGGSPALPKSGETGLGLALRIQSAGRDRGCLALYRDVDDPVAAAAYCARMAARDPRYPAVLPEEAPGLDLELSLFGPWRAMKGPLDFRPGLDSLIMIKGREVTLLQAPVALQHGCGREEFLARLCGKAGLGPELWRGHGLRFMRSATIWSRRSLASIEAGSDHQKYEKK